MTQKNAEADKWYNKYEKIKGHEEKIKTVLDICSSNKPIEFYKYVDIFEIIDSDIQKGFMENENLSLYFEFLDKFMEQCPVAFSVDFMWYIREMIKWHVYKENYDKVHRLANYLIENPKEEPDIIFDIIDHLILNNCIDDASSLSEKYYRVLSDGKETLGGGIFEMAIIGSMLAISKCLQENSCNYDALIKILDKYGLGQEEKIIKKRVDILNKKIGYAEWQDDNLTKKEYIYLLTLEFAMYLNENYKLDYAVSLYLHILILNYLLETKQKIDVKLNHKITDEYIASYAGGMCSLSQSRAFGILVALNFFYDFLKSKCIIDNDTYSTSQKTLTKLNLDLLHAFENSIWRYNFALKYLYSKK
ncbi:MAG: hypothetical protein V1859_01585 [archaeon]